MLYDVYKESQGRYLYVGPYAAGDMAVQALLDRVGDKYIWTVNEVAEADRAAREDHAGAGVEPMVGRVVSVAEAEGLL